MRRLLSLLGLILLGTLVFAGFAALVEYRQGHPLHPPTELQAAQGETERRPQEMITVGTRLSAATAQQALKRGARSEAVHALDAAMRAAEVGEHASHGQRQKAFQEASKMIKQARRAIQNGKPMAAQDHLETVASMLDTGNQAAPPDQAALPDQAAWSDYQDAVLLNAMGLRIGEVVRLQTSADGIAEAVLRLGGGQDVLGFLDVGGTERIVPVDHLLFGKRQTIGAVHMVLPTLASSVQQIDNVMPVAAHRPAS